MPSREADIQDVLVHAEAIGLTPALLVLKSTSLG